MKNILVRRRSGREKLTKEQYDRKKAYWQNYNTLNMTTKQVIRVYYNRINRNRPVHKKTAERFKKTYGFELTQAPIVLLRGDKVFCLVHRIEWRKGNIIEIADYYRKGTLENKR